MSRKIEFSSKVKLPTFKGKHNVELPNDAEPPFYDKNDPAHKQPQKRLMAHARVFDMADPASVEKYEEVWQSICDGLAGHYVEEKHWENGKCYIFLRWASIDIVLPS